MKKAQLLIALLLLGTFFSFGQSVDVSPKTVRTGNNITFTFSSGNGFEFTQATPTTNKLGIKVILGYINTSGSDTYGSDTYGSDTYGSNTYGSSTQGTNTYEWWKDLFQASYTQGTDTYYSYEESYYQGSETTYQGSSSILKYDCANVNVYDEIILPKILSSVNSNSLTATFDLPTYLPEGSIDFIFETNEPCPYVVENEVAVLGLVDIPEVSEENGINVTVYPNPFTAELHFDFDQEVEDVRYSIISITGATVQSGALETSEETIDVSSLRSGTYIVNIYNNNELVQSNRILKR